MLALVSMINTNKFFAQRSSCCNFLLCPVQPAQAAATRAGLHRRSIAQMRVSYYSNIGWFIVLIFVVLYKAGFVSVQINNRSIQDMYIFGDPLRIPIIIMERVINAPRRTFSENSYFRNLDLIDSPSLSTVPGAETGKELSRAETGKELSTLPQNGRELKIAVFVHGFQARVTLLQLSLNFEMLLRFPFSPWFFLFVCLLVFFKSKS